MTESSFMFRQKGNLLFWLVSRRREGGDLQATLWAPFSARTLGSVWLSLKERLKTAGLSEEVALSVASCT